MTKKKKQVLTLSDIEDKGRRLEVLINLSNNLRETEKREYVHFNDFLHSASEEPDFVFRDIFQYFHDMINYYVPEGYDDYEETQDSAGFLSYDLSKLLVDGCDDPFFADRLFANRLMNLAKEFKKGVQNNHIYLFEGPPGSGKSTFLNNLLFKVEQFSRKREGTMYKTVWRLDVKKLGGLGSLEKILRLDEQENENNNPACYNVPVDTSKKIIDISCPSNDHPILQIPKEFREKFLDELITDKKFKKKLFNSKEYRWVLKDSPCSICSSVYRMLLEKLDEPIEIYNMLYARKMLFDKQFGRGISVFNPGDEHTKRPVTDITLQNLISNLFKNDEIKYIYSQLANTNNGIYALMDIKDNNIQRLIDLHGIISDGIHKVEFSEERIKSLFVGLVNPEDKKHYEDVKSFQDRIINISIPYVLDYEIEVSIYKNKFGEEIEHKFLPGVLDNFAKIIISSRLRFDSPTIKKWIKNIDKYSKYLDDNNLLLKMELYKGIIPEWLSEEDIKNFNKQARKELIMESETEGLKGFSGRQSLSVFNNFFTKHAESDKLITMNMIKDFFAENEKYQNQIPSGFIESLEDMYDYNVLQEVKEAIYFYSEKQITKDILNYLFAINYDIGATEKSSYTGDIINITEDYLKNFEALLIGTLSSPDERRIFRKDIHNEYITHTIAYEMKLENKEITKTKLFGVLFEKYTRSLKENALAPYADNDNFRRVLMDYGSQDFNKYDEVAKRTVTRLLANMKSKFEYSLEGAKQICLYVIDKKLNKEY